MLCKLICLYSWIIQGKTDCIKLSMLLPKVCIFTQIYLSSFSFLLIHTAFALYAPIFMFPVFMKSFQNASSKLLSAVQSYWNKYVYFE